MFGVMIDIGPKFYTVLSPPLHDLKVKIMDFMLKVFWTSLFPNPVRYRIYTWYDKNTGPKFYAVTSQAHYMISRSRSRSYKFDV